ncbi:putative NAD(P)-binding protein [Kitasatospora sp. SolWspMP-SS2h]|uniref:NAD(P)H-binding protein n=1 Tax=Kitasatospora sp. SolWspMP-SS2h TaxID=1305729 RepID=UPI000DB9E935|nr:NAD(P)H-binding protein [Kitasatospora sp. SolWspMP-SS2h]RAJ44622.1 putative NAD(P)-binding protein [Kitasatospora sp. SolWspMP-SS2h]
MIVITGATGALNGATVDHLLARVPAAEIAVAVREPARARRFADLGVRVRHGDYADPASLPRAFEGADHLLLVSANDPGADAVALHRTAIDAAVAAGVGRVLYTSHQGAHPDSAFKPARDHAATEGLLADSGLAWTALRNGFYAHSLTHLAGPWRETGTLTVPADGPVSWTAREDAAEAAAVILAALAGYGGPAAAGHGDPTTAGHGGPAARGYDGPVTLTAAAAPTFHQVADLAAELSGRPVRCVAVDPEEWVATQVASGTPEFMARFTLGIYQAAAQGRFAGTDPLLSALLAREPRTVRDLLADDA